MLLYLILIVCTYSATADSNNFTAQCFSSVADYAVSNAHPIAELFRVTVSECLNYCVVNSAKIGYGCASVVYHREFSTCQLYGHDGYYNGASVVGASGHDFFARRSWIGGCADRIAPKFGYQQKPKLYGVRSAKKHITPISIDPNFAVLRSQNKEAKATVSEPIVPVTTTTEKIDIPLEFETLEEEPYEEPKNTITFLNPTHNSVCSKREKMGYFILFGYKLAVRQKFSKLNGVDQSSCVMYCSQNIDNQGTNVPCYSANYDPVNEKCQLYGEQDRSNRNLAVLGEDKNFIFADKFCMKTKKDCSNESPFIVYPFKQMHKKIISHYPGMNSVVACVAVCIDNNKCKAVTYKEGLCILHGSTPADDFNLLVDGNEETMVIENGCQITANNVQSMISNSISQTNEPEWEEWSPCQFGIGGKRMRVRHRDCEKCEDLQVEEC